jgi:hypothetical protein
MTPDKRLPHRLPRAPHRVPNALGVAHKLEREGPGPRDDQRAQARRGEERVRIDVGALERGGVDGVEWRLHARAARALRQQSAHADAQDTQHALERHRQREVGSRRSSSHAQASARLRRSRSRPRGAKSASRVLGDERVAHVVNVERAAMTEGYMEVRGKRGEREHGQGDDGRVRRKRRRGPVGTAAGHV